MDLVNLAYRYVNKFINIHHLLKELTIIKYKKEEKVILEKLILDINYIKDNYPNEIDNAEINRQKDLDNMINVLTNIIKYDSDDKKTEKFIKNNVDYLQKQKDITAFITISGIVSVFNIISTNMKLREREFAILRSTGLSNKNFNKMIRFESIFLGLKTLFYGIIYSLLLFILWIGLYYMMTKEIIIEFPYMYYAIGVVGIVFIIFIIMHYSSSKIKNKNIIEQLQNENV